MKRQSSGTPEGSINLNRDQRKNAYLVSCFLRRLEPYGRRTAGQLKLHCFPVVLWPRTSKRSLRPSESVAVRSPRERWWFGRPLKHTGSKPELSTNLLD